MEKFVVKRITKYDGIISETFFKERFEPVQPASIRVSYSLSMFQAKEFDTYGEANDIIKLLLADLPYDTSTIYQIEKIFK